MRTIICHLGHHTVTNWYSLMLLWLKMNATLKITIQRVLNQLELITRWFCKQMSRVQITSSNLYH